MRNAERPALLNAITLSQPESAAERTARHLRMCAEMADLAAQLARAVAARALAELAQPVEPSAAPFEPAAEPPPESAAERLSEPAPEPDAESILARAAAQIHAAETSLGAPSFKSIGWAVLFTRLVATMRACIALEARLAAGVFANSCAASLNFRRDPRRDPLRETFRYVTERQPGHADLLRASTTRLDEVLAADPDQTITHAEIFFSICDELGIEIDLARVPDKYLDLLAGPPETDADEAPDPRATSPP